jgi:hypothetical protein
MVRMSLVMPEAAYSTMPCHDAFFFEAAAAESLVEVELGTGSVGVALSGFSSFSLPVSHGVCRRQ